MKNHLKLSILILSAACSGISAIKPLEIKRPSETVLQQLVNTYRTNREIIQMNQTAMERALSDASRQEFAQTIYELKEKNRALIKRVARLGLTAAFIAALSAASALVAKKYGTPLITELLKKEKMEQAQKEIRAVQRPPLPDINNGEEVERWKEEQKEFEKAGLYSIGDV